MHKRPSEMVHDFGASGGNLTNPGIAAWAVKLLNALV
jgi:hypothetical protein